MNTETNERLAAIEALMKEIRDALYALSGHQPAVPGEFAATITQWREALKPQEDQYGQLWKGGQPIAAGQPPESPPR